MMGVLLMVLCLISIPAAIAVPTTNNNTFNINNSGLADRNESTTAPNAIAVAATVNATTTVGDGKRFQIIYHHI